VSTHYPGDGEGSEGMQVEHYHGMARGRVTLKKGEKMDRLEWDDDDDEMKEKVMMEIEINDGRVKDHFP